MTSVSELGVKISPDGIDETSAKIVELIKHSEMLEKEVIKLKDAANKGFRGLSNAADQANQSLYQLAETAGTIAGRAFNLLAGYLSVREYVRLADTWSDLSARVANAIGPHEDAARVMKDISDMARVSYSDLGTTAEAFINNAQSLQELGLSTSQQLKYQEALNNALVVSGTKGERATSVQLAFGNALALGALRGDQLNSVLLNGDRISKSLAKELGVTVNQLRKLGSEGKITSDVMIKAMINDFDTLRKEAGDMPATIGDAFTLMSNAALVAVGTFDKFNNISGTIANGLVNVADGAAWLAENVVTVTRAVSMFALVLGLNLVSQSRLAGAAFTFLRTQIIAFNVTAALSGGLVRGLSVAIGTTLVSAISAAKIAFMSFLPTAILQAAFVAVAYLVTKFFEMSRAVGGFGLAASLAFEAVKWEITNLGATLNMLWNGLQASGATMDAWADDMRAAVWDATSNFRNSFTQLDGHLSAIFTGMLLTVVGWVESANRKVLDGANFIIGAFRGAAAAIGAIFANLPGLIGAGVVAAVNFVIRKINEMINAAKGLVNGLIAAMNSIPGVNLPPLTIGGETIKTIENDAMKAYSNIGKAATDGFRAGAKTFRYEENNAITQYKQTLEKQKAEYERISKETASAVNPHRLSAEVNRAWAEIFRGRARDARQGGNPFVQGIRGAMQAAQDAANAPLTTPDMPPMDLPPGLGGGGAGDKGKGKGGKGGLTDAAKLAQDQMKSLAELREELEKYRATVGMTALEEEIWNKQKETGAQQNPVLAGQVEAMVREIDNLRTRQEAMRQMAQTIEQSFGAAFNTIVSGSGSAKDAISQLLSSLAQMLANQAFQSLWGIVGKGITSAIGGAAGVSIPVGKNANGTSNWAGGLTSVHERGGEIMDLPGGTRIYPHDVSKRMASRQQQNGTLKIIVEPSGEFRTEMDDRALSAAVQVVKGYNSSPALNKQVRNTIRKPRSVG